MRDRQLSSASYPIPFLLVSSTDHVTAVTGITPTVTIRKVGGSFAAPAGSVTEIASGWYELAGNATDRNTLGALLIHATGAGADPVDLEYTIVAYDPFDAADLGLTNLDAAISTRGTADPGDAMTLTAAYDLAKTAAQAGDAMTLTAAYNAAKTAAQAGDAMALSAGGVTSILSGTVEGAETVVAVLRYLLAFLAGETSGFPLSPVIKSKDGTKSRLVATLDLDGNRTMVSTDGS